MHAIVAVVHLSVGSVFEQINKSKNRARPRKEIKIFLIGQKSSIRKTISGSLV